MTAKRDLVKSLRDLRPVSSLILLPDNPRHGDIGAISQSLERFGQQKPIVVNSDGVILAGNHTFQAAKALGWEEIWVTESELEGRDQPGFALADNRLSDLATYDHDALLRILEDQPDLTGTGYELDDLDEVRQQIAFEKGEPDFAGDERYTPAWVFEGMAVRFDVDLAAPVGGVAWIPADTFYTKEDDARLKDWRGQFAWCNPPYSIGSEFGKKWNLEVSDGVWLGPQTRGSPYRLELMKRSQMIWLPLDLQFHKQESDPEGIRYPVFLAGIGKGAEALENLAKAYPDEGILLAVQ